MATKHNLTLCRSGHFAYAGVGVSDDGKDIQTEMESFMIRGANHEVECLSFNYSLKANGAVSSLAVVQQDEEQETTGGQVVDEQPW